MTDQRTVRIGVLGTATIAREAVIPAVLAAPNAELVAVASRTRAKAESTAELFDVEAVHGYRQLLDRDDIDAVYVPLPNHLHVEWTIEALERGKHVLCEKPLALDASGVRQINEVASHHRLLAMEAFMHPFHPQWDAIDELLATGAIGELAGIDSVFVFREDDPDHIVWNDSFGGGALLDVGCYLTSVARHILGRDSHEAEVIGADSRLLTVGNNKGPVDASTSATLRFGEATARIECSIDDSPESQHLRIRGSRGQIDVATPFNPGADESIEFIVSTFEDGPDVRTRTVACPPSDNYRRMIEAFCRSVLGDEPPPISPGDSLANAVLLDQIRAATR